MLEHGLLHRFVAYSCLSANPHPPDPRQVQQPDTKKKKKLKRHKASDVPTADLRSAPSENATSSAVPSSGRPKRSRGSSTSSVEPKPKRKQKGEDALLVSIDRTQVQGQQSRLIPGSGMRVKKWGQVDAKDSAVKSDGAAGGRMTVRVSRSKLKGEFGKRPLPMDSSGAVMMEPGRSFMLARSTSDQVVPSTEHPGETLLYTDPHFISWQRHVGTCNDMWVLFRLVYFTLQATKRSKRRSPK